MDLNREYAAHQRALMAVDDAANGDEHSVKLATASTIAARIGTFQHRLGAAAACAWSISHGADPEAS